MKMLIWFDLFHILFLLSANWVSTSESVDSKMLWSFNFALINLLNIILNWMEMIPHNKANKIMQMIRWLPVIDWISEIGNNNNKWTCKSVVNLLNYVSHDCKERSFSSLLTWISSKSEKGNI